MPSSSKKILITGAAGHVGRALTAAWKDSYRLTLLDVRPVKQTFGAHAVIADIRDGIIMHALCEHHDTVVHLAISGNLSDPPNMLAPVNLIGTRNLMRIAAFAGCRRLIYASSLSIDLYPDRAYSQAKLATETCAREISESTPLSIHCLRLGAVLPARHPLLWPGNKNLDHVLTHSDMVKLFTCSVEASSEIHYGVFNGISNNKPSSHDISCARASLGYEPNDVSQAIAHQIFNSPCGLLRRVRSRLLRLIRRQTCRMEQQRSGILDFPRNQE